MQCRARATFSQNQSRYDVTGRRFILVPMFSSSVDRGAMFAMSSLRLAGFTQPFIRVH